MKHIQYLICGLLALSTLTCCAKPKPLPPVKKVMPKPEPPLPVSYQDIDSIRVSALLAAADTLPDDTNFPLFFGRQLKGIPYVSNTLEKGRREKLIVNLRGLDCTTFVETVTALTKTRKQHGHWNEYLKNLENLRYQGGKMKGYCSRLHYFSMWIADNTARGNVDTINTEPAACAMTHINLNFMSRHPRRYRHLRNNMQWVDTIRALEKKFSGYNIHFVPARKLDGSRKELSFIHNGDILALVIGNKGLDYSHLGFAAWGKDGKLHLLNASFLHKCVVEEPMPLYVYMKRHPSQRGVSVVRIK